MTDKRITDLSELTSPVNNDYLVAVDVSDTTASPQGTTKKVTLQNLFNKTNFFGWAYYEDAQYTQGAPLSIVNGARTQITNNAGSSATNETYLNETQSLWVNDRITPVSVGDTYDVRLTFKVIAATNDKDLTLDLDIGSGTPIKIYEESRRMLKTAGQENSFGFSVPIFCLNTFFANGGKFYITANDNIQLYGVSILIVKTFRNLA